MNEPVRDVYVRKVPIALWKRFKDASDTPANTRLIALLEAAYPEGKGKA